MRVVVALEQRYEGTPDGKIWTTGPFPYSFWQRYLEVFDEVCVIARVRRVDSATSGRTRADGPGVTFNPVTYYHGPWEYLCRRHRVLRDVRRALRPTDAVILRVVSQVAAGLETKLLRTGHPFAVEVVGDPYDVFAPGAVKHPLRPFLRWWYPRQLRRQCSTACAAAYVTESSLQRRYPIGSGNYCTNYSSVELPPISFRHRGDEIYSTAFSDVELSEASFATSGRFAASDRKPCRLICVGTLEQLYKGPDVLLDSLGICTRGGLDVELTWIGGGKLLPSLEAKARAMGLGEKVHFVGQVPAGEQVRAYLDRANLFVLPSKQEGLPRALIEAMARAMPCIGSTIGGIPELLPGEDLVPPGDASALAEKIRDVASNPERMARMSARNLLKSWEYRDDVLRERRLAFYQFVRDRTSAWLASKQDRTLAQNDVQSLGVS